MRLNNHQRSSPYVILALTLTGILVGCTQVLPFDFEDNGEQADLLVEYNCLPPCWNGLIIGEATLQDLLHLLEQDTLVDENSIDTSTERSGSDWFVYYWSSIERTTTDDIAGAARVDNENGLLIDLVVYPDSDIHLGSLLITLGKPDYYIVMEARPQHPFIQIVWLSSGFEITIYDLEQPLTSDASIDTLRYFSPVETLEAYLITFDYTKQEEEAVVNEYQAWESLENVNP